MCWGFGMIMLFVRMGMREGVCVCCYPGPGSDEQRKEIPDMILEHWGGYDMSA